MADVEYSERLGRIADAQFALATERLGVGRFVSATPTTGGLFGQNVFLTTSEGEFVLRGAPHWVDTASEGAWNFQPNDRWQFTKEILFARLLHEHTDAPVPWPQQFDESKDIFGWPYIIMPRMPGTCFDDRSIRKALSPDQRLGVAAALGTALSEQQRLEWPFAGDVDPSLVLCAYPGGHAAHVARQTLRFADNARTNDSWSKTDDAWIARIIDTAMTQADGKRPNVYVHGDYKLGNLCVAERSGEWRVSGVFDLHESRFGDGASDLCRQMCSYIDTDETLARTFLDNYRARRDLGTAIEARLPLYLINDRVKLWEYFTRPPVASWLAGQTFENWAGRYIDRALLLLR